MPLLRFEVKSEYGLGDPELYRAESKKEDPKAVLDGVAVAGLAGILRQLGDLAGFAADIFHDLHDEVMITAARGRKILTQVRRIESALPSLEKAVQGQRSYMHFAYIEGSNWHTNIPTGQSRLLDSDLPQFMIDSYEECRDPPRLYLLDKFDSSGAGACLKRYSDPSYFKRVLASSQPEKPKKVKRKKKKRGSRLRSGGIYHTLLTSCDSNSTQFASPSTGHLSFSGDNGSVSVTRSKSDLMSKCVPFNSETRSNYVEQVSEGHCILHGEREDGGFSACMSEGNHGNPTASALDNEPKQHIAGDHSGVESSRWQSDPSTCSVSWDEKTEILKSMELRSCEAELADGSQDLDPLPQILGKSKLDHEAAEVEAVNEEDIVLELANEPLSYLGDNLLGKDPTVTDNFAFVSSSGGKLFDEIPASVDESGHLTNTLEPETEVDSNCQSKQKSKSFNFRCDNLASRSCGLIETSGKNLDCFDAQAPIASSNSLNHSMISDHSDDVQSTNATYQAVESDLTNATSYIPSLPRTNVSELLDCELCPELSVASDQDELCGLIETSGKILDCFDDQAPIASSNSLNHCMISDHSDDLQSTNATYQAVESDLTNATSYIPSLPRTNVSELLDCELCPELSVAGDQDELVKNGTVNEMAKSPYCPPNVSSLCSVRLWTNGGILGVEPSKPPHFSVSANPEAADMNNGSKSINMCSVEEREKSDGEVTISKISQDSVQDASLVYLGRNQESPNGRACNIGGVDNGEIDDISAESDFEMCNSVSHPNGSDRNFQGISAGFSGITQKFLSNRLQRRMLIAHAGLSAPSKLVNADFRKLQEISLEINNKELPKRHFPNALCEAETEENIILESLGKPLSSCSPCFGSSSPPLGHMKISFQPMDDLDTSKLKLEFFNCNLDQSNGDLVFPAFQLIPGSSPTWQNSCSESDDDTFCRSSLLSSDDLLTLHSESSSEFWGEDERSQRHELADNSCGNSLSASSSMKSKEIEGCSIASEEYGEVENGRVDSTRDLSLAHSVICDSNEQREISELLAFVSIDSTSHSSNALLPPLPLAPLQCGVAKHSDEHHSAEETNYPDMVFMEYTEAQSQNSTILESWELGSAASVCNAEAVEHSGEQKNQQILTGSRGADDNHIVKEQNGRRDLLYNSRSKSLNRIRMVTVKPRHSL